MSVFNFKHVLIEEYQSPNFKSEWINNKDNFISNSHTTYAAQLAKVCYSSQAQDTAQALKMEKEEQLKTNLSEAVWQDICYLNEYVKKLMKKVMYIN